MCAQLSLKAIIEGYDRQAKAVQQYSQDIFSKISGFMLPFSVLRVLKKHKIPHKRISGRKLDYDQKIKLLQYHLHNGPIFLLIANAYCGKMKPKMRNALTHRHYITVRGYNNKNQIFFIYDSNTQERIFKNVPLGNSRMPYKELIKNR